MVDLPNTLNYLEKVIEELDRLPPEDITEENDFIASAVHRVFVDRVKGLDAFHASERLRRDARDLARCLEVAATKSAAVAYIQGYLAVLQSADLSSHSDPPVTDPHIVFLPPKGFEDAGSQRGTHFRKGTIDILLSPLDEASFVRQFTSPCADVGSLRAAFPNLPQFVDSEVSLGPVVGRKRRTLRGGKGTIDYVLEVPGGYVRVSVQFSGDTVDEHEIESHLGSLEYREKG